MNNGDKMGTDHHFRVRLVHSGAGRKPAQRRTLAGLGLVRLQQTVAVRDTPALRGMILRVSHLVEVTRCAGALPPSPRMLARRTAAS